MVTLGEQSVAVVEPLQHECADQVGGDVTTQQAGVGLVSDVAGERKTYVLFFEMCARMQCIAEFNVFVPHRRHWLCDVRPFTSDCESVQRR